MLEVMFSLKTNEGAGNDSGIVMGKGKLMPHVLTMLLPMSTEALPVRSWT